MLYCELLHLYIHTDEFDTTQLSHSKPSCVTQNMMQPTLTQEHDPFLILIYQTISDKYLNFLDFLHYSAHFKWFVDSVMFFFSISCFSNCTELKAQEETHMNKIII